MKTAASTSLIYLHTGKTGPSITTTAHEWRLTLPLSANLLTCARCGLTTTIGHWGVPRCVEHKEFDASGYIDESEQ